MSSKEVTECMHFERMMKRMEYQIKKSNAENRKRQFQEDTMIKQAQRKNR